MPCDLTRPLEHPTLSPGPLEIRLKPKFPLKFRNVRFPIMDMRPDPTTSGLQVPEHGMAPRITRDSSELDTSHSSSFALISYLCDHLSRVKQNMTRFANSLNFGHRSPPPFRVDHCHSLQTSKKNRSSMACRLGGLIGPWYERSTRSTLARSLPQNEDGFGPGAAIARANALLVRAKHHQLQLQGHALNGEATSAGLAWPGTTVNLLQHVKMSKHHERQSTHARDHHAQKA